MKAVLRLSQRVTQAWPWSLRCAGWLVGACLVIASGCEAPLPDTPPPLAPPAPENAFERWTGILALDPPDRDVEQAVLLTSMLGAQPNGLAPMVALLADPARSPEDKVFAVLCLTTQREALANFEAELIGWTGSTQPLQTRTFATHVLGLLDSPGAREAMRLLLDDTAQPVREAAMGVLLSFHPEMVEERLASFWADPTTSAAVRDQVVLGMPPHLVERHVDIYAEAVLNESLSQPARLKSISVLGQLGRAEHTGVLEQCIASATDSVIKEHAQGALALLRAATELGTTAQP
jgi:hypothetical protein